MRLAISVSASQVHRKRGMTRAGVLETVGRFVGQASELTPKQPTDLVASLKAPVLGLYGGAAQGIPPDTVWGMEDKPPAARGPPMIHRHDAAQIGEPPLRPPRMPDQRALPPRQTTGFAARVRRPGADLSVGLPFRQKDDYVEPPGAPAPLDREPATDARPCDGVRPAAATHGPVRWPQWPNRPAGDLGMGWRQLDAGDHGERAAGAPAPRPCL